MLAADVDEVGHLHRRRLRSEVVDVGQELDVGHVVAPHERDETGEGPDAHDVETGHERGLVDVGRRHDQPPRPDRTGGERRDQGPADGAHLAVEPELADDHQLGHRVRGHLAARGEQGEGDRQVEGRPPLGQLGRREAHGVLRAWPLEAGVEDRRPAAVARLPHQLVREADDGEARDADRHVRLDADHVAVDAEQHDPAGARHAAHDRPRTCSMTRCPRGGASTDTMSTRIRSGRTPRSRIHRIPSRSSRCSLRSVMASKGEP